MERPDVYINTSVSCSALAVFIPVSYDDNDFLNERPEVIF